MRSDAVVPNLFFGVGNPYLNPHDFALIGRSLDPESLFDVLDLDRPGLAAVRAFTKQHDRVNAARSLLVYYRARTAVAWSSWPADQLLGLADASRSTALLSANDIDVAVAQNAMRHIFQPYAAYPPTDYGAVIDWDWDPHGNIEWPAHMHRMSGWDLSTARCYSTTGDERYAQVWVDLTTDWIRSNPITTARCYFPQSWDAIQVGIRSTRWCGLLPYFLHSSALMSDFLVLFLTALYNHARRSYLIPYPNRDNFAIIESAGLADIALAFPEFLEANEWREDAFARLDIAMHEQVLPDGVHGELSPAYHLYCANLFLDIADTALRNGYSVPFTSGVARMAEVLLGITTPQRRLPVVGDASPADTRPFLLKASQVFQRVDLRAAATDGAQDAWPTRRNFAFRSGGFYALRSDWSGEAVWMCLHCGPASIQPSAFHAQFDNGTFELIANGRYLMRDPGVYCYARNDPWREMFRRTAAHQTLTLNGDNSVRAGHLLQWIEDDGQGNAILVVENDAYPYLTHRRTVWLVARRYFVLVDEALGSAQGTLDLHFQMAPGPFMLNEQAKTARTLYSEGTNLLVWVDPHAPVTLEPEEAWFSPEHNRKEPMPAFRYRHAEHCAPARFLTVLVPWKDRDVPRVAATMTGGDIGSDLLELNLTIAGVDYNLCRSIDT